MRNMWRTLAGGEGIIIRWGREFRFWMWKRLRSEAPTNNRGNARLHREESGEGLQRDLLDWSQSLFYFVILTDKQARKKEESGRVG